MLTEMAEKLRQARRAGFGEEIESPRSSDAGTHDPGQRPVPARRDADAASEHLQGPSRIDSLERRLFELRVALDEAVGRQAEPPSVADTHAPSDAEAWIAFAAAAAGRSDDAAVQAGVAAACGTRRASGGGAADCSTRAPASADPAPGAQAGGVSPNALAISS